MKIPIDQLKILEDILMRALLLDKRVAHLEELIAGLGNQKTSKGALLVI